MTTREPLLASRRRGGRPCARAQTWAVFFLFGTLSWTLVTALFAEAAYFQRVLPEGQAIFADLDAAMELGNVVPALLFAWVSSERALRKHNARITYAVVGVAIGTAALWAATWDITVGPGGSATGSATGSAGSAGSAGRTSLFALLAAWLSGAVGSTSMVAFFNFAAQYGPDAISATSVGIGACGLVTNVLGIAQGLPRLKDRGKSNSSHAGNGSTRGSHSGSGLPVVASSSSWAVQVSSASSDDAGGDDGLLFGPSIFFLAVGAWLILSAGAILLTKLRCCALSVPNGHAALSDRKEGSGSSSSRLRAQLRDAEGADVAVNATAPLPVGLLEEGQDRQDGVGKKGLAFIDSALSALRENPGPMAAIFLSCLTQFAMPGLVPYLVPCGSDHASNSFWVTLFYLTGSLLGRIVTVAFHCERFTLLNTVQTSGLVYAIIVTRMTVPLPVWVSIIVITAFSSVHGYIVTEVIHIVGTSAQKSAVGGLMNQFGALTGSLCTFLLVKMAVIVKREC
jgi:hypothetical protein